jgi:hypothetical protein
MIPVLATLLMAVSASSSRSADSTKSRPLLAVFVQGAFEWGGLTTGETPLTIVYDDGTVIYCVRRTKNEIKFETVKLSPDELKTLLDSLSLDTEFFGLLDHYDNLPNVTDMPLYIFRAWHGDTMKTVSLVGTFDSSTVPVRLTRADLAASTPSVLVRLFNTLCNYRHSGARAWQPAQFEAIASDFPQGVNAPRPWPRDWPTIRSPGARRDSLGTYRFGMTKEQASTFLRKYSKDVNERPFAMSGSNWFVRVRAVIPGEEAWIH